MVSCFRPFRVSNGIHQLFPWNLFVVIKITVPRCSAYTACSNAAMQVSIFWREFMSVFAVSLCALFSCMRPNRWHYVAARIGALFFARSPSTIARLVVSIIVDSIKRIAWRAHTHIGNKVLKTGATWNYAAPALANSDTTSTPMFKVWQVRISASLNHGAPTVVHGLQGFIAHLSLHKVMQAELYHGALK